MNLNKMTIPLIQGGMGIGVSLGNLAGHVAKEGGMGIISTANPGYKEADYYNNHMEANFRALQKEVDHARSIASGNGLIGVNVMVAAKEYEAVVKASLECGIDAIISGAGLPLQLPEYAAGYDVLLAPIVSSGRGAAMICRVWKKRYDRLPDFIVIEGSLAGGHLGFKYDEILSSKNLAELLQEVQEAIKEYGSIPIYLAGGVFTSKEIVDYIRAGAAGVQMATRFIATDECDASDAFKKVILEATDEDCVIMKSPVGMPGRAVNTPLVQKLQAGIKVGPTRCVRCLTPCNPATTHLCISQALVDGVNGDYENGLFFCSSSVGKINTLTSVKELIDEIMVDWRKL